MFRVGWPRLERSRGMVAGMVAGFLLVPLPAHAAAPLYGPATPYAVGSQPRSIATLDADGDGVLDVVSANFGDGSVSLLRGLGDGTFGPSTSTAVGGSPTTVTVGDFNHDHDPDLAITTFATAPAVPVVAVLLGSTGTSFGAPVTYPLAQNALGGAVADLDLDGNLDIVAVDPFGVSVLTGAADGSFGPPVRRAVGTFLASVAVADLNHDGDPDLALGQFAGQVLVLLGGPGVTFGPALGYAAGSAPDFVGVGDVDGDTHLDLVVADFNASDVSVLLGAGNGTFASATSYGTGTVSGMATHVVVAKLDGDAHPDIVVTNSFTHDVSVLINAGDGTFGPAATYSVAGNSPFATAVGEFDHDGGGDLAVANAGSANVSVLLSHLPNHPPDCGAVKANPDRLWPPNHRMQSVLVAGARDPDGDDLTTVITGVTQDEPVERFLGLEITPDAQIGVKPGEVSLHAERDASRDGRVYRIAFTVTDVHAASCSGVARVGVPPSAHATAVDSGASYNSLAPGQRPAWWWRLIGRHR